MFHSISLTLKIRGGFLLKIKYKQMEIKTLIKLFKSLLPIYQNAYNNNYDWEKLYDLYLSNGICGAAYNINNENIYDIIAYHYSSNGYLFPLPNTGKDLITRINFMKKEIPYLENLIKKGYTHL